MCLRYNIPAMTITTTTPPVTEKIITYSGRLSSFEGVGVVVVGQFSEKIKLALVCLVSSLENLSSGFWPNKRHHELKASYVL